MLKWENMNEREKKYLIKKNEKNTKINVPKQREQ